MRPTLTALLVDDEPAASQGLRKLLAAHPEIQVIGAVTSVADARDFLQQQQADVIFLDMEMPSGLGLELLRFLDSAVKVVFVTASEKYAINAFDARAVDYLVKPIGPERLADTVQRLTHNILLEDEDIGDDEDLDQPYPPHLMENGFAKMIKLPNSKSESTQTLGIDQILCIESLQNYTQLHTKNSATGIIFCRRLGWWESILPRDHFKRLGRSFIVAIHHVRSTEWSSRDETLVHFQESDFILKIRRATATKLKNIIRGEMGKPF